MCNFFLYRGAKLFSLLFLNMFEFEFLMIFQKGGHSSPHLYGNLPDLSLQRLHFIRYRSTWLSVPGLHYCGSLLRLAHLPVGVHRHGWYVRFGHPAQRGVDSSCSALVPGFLWAKLLKREEE